LAGEITVHIRILRSIKIKYFLPEGATKATDFLCISISTVLLTHNFYIKTIFINKQLQSMVKNCLLLLVFIC